MELELKQYPIGDNKGFIFADVTRKYDNDGYPQGWGVQENHEFADYAYPSDNYVKFVGTFKTPSKTYEFDIDLIEVGIFGTDAEPITSQEDSLNFALVIGIDNDIMTVIKTSDYDSSLYKQFPDGILNAKYGVSYISSPPSYDDEADVRYVLLENSKKIIDEKVINLDLKFFTNNYDINSLLDVLIMDGLIIAAEKYIDENREDACLKMIEAIGNTNNEYYID